MSSSDVATQQQQQNRRDHATRLSEWTRLLIAYTNTLQKSSSSRATNHHDNLNTSFSVASYHMRQRKLLRQITVLMKQLAFRNPHEEAASSSRMYTFYFLKSSTDFGSLSLHQQEQYLQEEKCHAEQGSSETGGEAGIGHFVNQILYSVYNVLIQESAEIQKRRLQDETCQSNKNHDWIVNPIEDEEETRENLVTNLEFLDAALTCLDFDVVVESLLGRNGHVSECEYECECEVGNECGKNGSGKNFGNRVVNALLEFITKNGAVVDSIQDWEDVQKLSLSVLTKVMICTEYIQMHCSSKCVLLREGFDSLLGRGIGLGLEDGTGGGEGMNELHILGQTLIQWLFGGTLRPSSSSSWTDGREGHDEQYVLFQMSCIGLLSVLHRTGLVSLSSYEYDNVVAKELLHKELKIFEQMLSSDARDSSKESQFAYSSMVVSLSTMLPILDGESENDDTLVIDSDTIAMLLDIVFLLKRRPDALERDHRQSGATQVLMHLSWRRHGSLNQYVEQHGMDNLMGMFLHNLSTKKRCSNDSVCDSTLFAIIYLNQVWGYQIRKALKFNMEKQSCGCLENILKNILDSSTRNRFASFVPYFLFLKSIIFQIGSDGQFQIADQLAIDALEVLFEKFTFLETLCHNLSYYTCTGEIIRLHMFVDALHFFQSNIKYKIEVGTFIKEESTASLVKIINGAIDMTDTLHTLRCSLQITSASILSSIIINSKGDNQDQASLKNLLFRFATNSMEGNTSSYTGALEYAMTQTLSRDLLRRALNFQAAFSYISGDNAFHIANVLFSNAVGKSKSHSRLMKRVEQQQKDVEEMYIQNQSLVKERDSLLKKLDRAQFSFDRELNIRLSRAKADAIGAIEAQTEEKKKLERMVSTLENELSTERESTKRALTDAREEREIANQKIKEYKELSNDLQNRISAADRRLNESNSRLADADEKVEESKKALQRSLSENNELVQENNQVKVKLEKTLIQLISLTQIFTAKEQEHKSDQEVISRKVDEAQASVEIEVQKRHQLEEKYSLVKGKYQSLKEKYEDVVRQRDEERSRYEQDLKRERKRRQEEEMKSKRKNDIRKPMGTIDFVNSFHDASMLRSDRGSKANKSTSSRIDRKSGRSSFRIMK